MLGDHDRVSTAQTLMIYLVEEFVDRRLIDESHRASPCEFFPFEPEDVYDVEILKDRDRFLDVVFVLLDGSRYSREGALLKKTSGTSAA